MSLTADNLDPFICKARRRLAGLTVADLSERLGWPVQWIAEYEAGDEQALSKRALGKLADALEQAGVVNE